MLWSRRCPANRPFLQFVNLGGKRNAVSGSLPVAGRPRSFLGITLITRGHLGIGLLSPVGSPSQESMHEGEMIRLGKWGLIVPAKTAKPSSSINRVNALASASVANIFVSGCAAWAGHRACVQT
jgi:hypothetical protein